MSGSMFGQDRLVLDLLGGQRGGFFLDSGASDGVRGSNTWRLERDYGWQGICVEPDDAFFAALRRNRRSQCVQCCLYDRDGEVDFVPAEVLGGIFDEYHPQLLRQARHSYADAFDAAGRPQLLRRPARTAAAVLRACKAPPVIDYWSLDTEGSELAILRSFPFDQYRVRVLTVEHNHFPVRAQIRALLESQGYRWVAALAVDDCYVKDVPLPARNWRSPVWRRGSRALI
jgi:hypothetical protein